MNASDLLTRLGWSTKQGDAALAGSEALAVSDCPYPHASSLAFPWQAGWIAAAAQTRAPSLAGSRRTGNFSVILRANGASASLAVEVHNELTHSC